MRWISPLLVLFLLFLGGCKDLDVHSPAAVDFTGAWQLDAARSDSGGVHEHQRRPDMDERQMPGQAEQPATPGGLTGEANHDPRGHAPLPRLPMLTADAMTIDQDATSMGIAYPNQPYRDLKWGLQKHDLYAVRSGWDNGRLIVETSSTPMHITETYSLSDDLTTLTLRVDLKGKSIDTAHIVRVFVRKPST